MLEDQGAIDEIYMGYVEYVKTHKIIVKSIRVQVEPSVAYLVFDWGVMLRGHAEYEVINFEDLGKQEDINLLIYGNTYGDLPADKLVYGTYKSYFSKAYNKNQYSKLDTDYMFEIFSKSDIGLAIMYNDNSTIITPFNSIEGGK